MLSWSILFESNCQGFQTTRSPIVDNRWKKLNLKKDSDNNNDEGDFIQQRFLSPKIDDMGLPVADALIAQVVAPTFQILWLFSNRAPIPTWLCPISGNGLLFNAGGSFLAPTLIHGAGLAFCWITGALAAKAYESDAFDVGEGKGYGTIIIRILQAGSFAAGLLILSTQIDLLLEYGRWVQLGESNDTDIRLLNAIVELTRDIFFEALVVGSWRLYRASLTNDPSGRPS